MTKKTPATKPAEQSLSSSDPCRVFVSAPNPATKVDPGEGPTTPPAVAMVDSFRGLEDHAKAAFEHMRRTFHHEQ
jgi:hypothetical protein